MLFSAYTKHRICIGCNVVVDDDDVDGKQRFTVTTKNKTFSFKSDVAELKPSYVNSLRKNWKQLLLNCDLEQIGPLYATAPTTS